MTPAEDTLVGRGAERARVDKALDRVGEGSFAAIAVVGEPGIGKSSLLADVARKADDRRWLAVGGASSELDSHAPFAAFADALDAYLGCVPADRFDALGTEVFDEVASVFQSLARTSKTARRNAPSERFRTNRAVRSLLEVLAADRPVVIVLDDLHWADPASVDLVATLLSKPPMAPMLLAFGVRSRQMSARLTSTLDRAVRAGAIDRVDLDTLTRRDIERLLVGDFTRADVDRIYDESGGNPFYARQLAGAATRSESGGGSIPSSALADLQVPPMVSAALAEELELLSDAARLVVNGAAVAGALLETLDDSAISAAGSGSLLSALAESGEPEQALEVVRTLGGGLEAPLIGGTWRVQRLEIVTRCLVATGEVTEAERIATLAHQLATSFGLPMPTGMACRALGAVALAYGDPAAAVIHRRQAVAALDEAGMVGETARALLFTGRALGAAAQVDDATVALDRAIDIFSEIGNARRRGETDQELRRLGRHVHRRTQPGNRAPLGIGSLTERERQIADLVVDRRTNGEIAAELFLSPKTIETHLRNIFRKLDVGSRVEVARVIERAT